MGQGGPWESGRWVKPPLQGWMGVVWSFVSSESPPWCGGLTQKEREKENFVAPPGFHGSGWGWAWWEEGRGHHKEGVKATSRGH